MTCDERRLLLDALVDGQLSPGEEVELQRHLDSCPACRTTVERIEAVRRAVKRVEPYTVPDMVQRHIERALPSSSRRFALVPILAMAAILVLALGLWRHFAMAPREDLIAEITSEHLRSTLVGHLLDVTSTDRHTVKPWFIGKVAAAPTPYDLKDSGFPLLGGRLDVIQERPTPVFVYGHGKHVLNLFVLPAGEPTGEWTASRRGFSLAGWHDHDLQFVAISDADLIEVDRFAKAYRRAEATP